MNIGVDSVMNLNILAQDKRIASYRKADKKD